MARLLDVSKVFRSVGLIPFVLRVWQEVTKDNLFTWAAALAYSWLFAIFPFFIFVLAVIPHLPARVTRGAIEQIHVFIRAFPPQVADVLWTNVSRLSHTMDPKTAKPLIVVGLVVALWSASSGTSNTMSALDRCYELERGRPFWKHRILAIGLTIVVALVLLLVLVLLPVATLVKTWIVNVGHLSKLAPWLVAFDVARWTAAILLMFAVLSLMYYFGPAVKHRFAWVTPGAVFAVAVWIGLGLGFRFYIVHIGGKGYAKTYGTVGGVAIMLLLFYLDALVLLIGAEINSEIDFEVLKVRRGSLDLRKAEDVSAAAEPVGL
jgi:membrane protein